MGISRSILEVLNRYNHPVAVITKSILVQRDIDILANMAKRRLAKVAISVTTLSTELKQIMEPRTAAPTARLRMIQTLSEAGIPVTVMAAPMIPMINDAELEQILQLARAAGASYAGYTFIRLPYEVKELFKTWLQQHYPDRAEHVMSLIRQSRGGKEYDATFGQRMQGQGEFATLLGQRFQLACKRLQLNTLPHRSLDTQKFKVPEAPSQQLELFH